MIAKISRNAKTIGAVHIFAVLALAMFTRVIMRPAIAQQPVSMKVILDTDIGDDIDDAYALALLATQPNVKLLGVTTSFGQTKERAEVASKLLKVMGRNDVPVYAGRRGPSEIRRQYEWAKGFNSSSLKKEDAVTFLKREIDKNPGEITLVAIGPLVNIGDLLSRYPEVKPKIRQIVIMGGSVYTGYNSAPSPTPEWNIKCDPAAAKIVYNSGVPLVMAGLEVTAMMQLDPEKQRRIFAYGTPLTDALAALTKLWGDGSPVLYDPVAVAYFLGHSFCESEKKHVVVEDSGLTRITEGVPNVSILIKPKKDTFLDWYVSALKPPGPQ